MLPIICVRFGRATQKRGGGPHRGCAIVIEFEHGQSGTQMSETPAMVNAFLAGARTAHHQPLASGP